MKSTSLQALTACEAREGFTLPEVLVASAVVALCFVAVLTAFQSGMTASDASNRKTIAVFLAQEVREWTLSLPFRDPDEPGETYMPGNDGASPQIFVDDLDDLMGQTYSPPMSAERQYSKGNNLIGTPLVDLRDWSQTIRITYRAEDDPAEVSYDESGGTMTGIARVEVTIRHRGEEELTVSWLVAEKK